MGSDSSKEAKPGKEAKPAKPAKLTPEAKAAAERKAAWAKIRQELPQRRTSEDKARRIDLFKRFDSDHTGSLTLDETYDGCVNVLHLERFTPHLLDIVKRAFNKAKDMGTKDRNAGANDKVEFLEFRLMLCYIYDYFELTVMFDEIDSSGNMMVDKKEFVKARPLVESWGIRIDDAEAAFAEIDSNGSGKATFDEFANWALSKRLDADGDPDTIASTGREKQALWEKRRYFVPRRQVHDEKALRLALFKRFDVNSSEALTLDEAYDGCVNVLRLDEITPRLHDIVKRSFTKAKKQSTKENKSNFPNKLEFLEFRLMFCHLYEYCETSVMFDVIDADADGSIESEEFVKAAGVLAEYGAQVKNPEHEFKEMNDNSTGKATFDEFYAWAHEKKLEIKGNSMRDENEEKEKTAAERKAAWEKIRQQLPRKKTPEDKARRVELFKQFDADDSGSLTLEETYKGCIEFLHLDEFTTRLRDIVKRAFNKACDLGTKDRGAGEEDKVEFLEFRLMLCYIYDYFELTVMFDEIDESGDMFLQKDELAKAAPKIAEWGVPMDDPDAVFAEIDDNNSGKITFDEFAAWASAKKLDADGDPDNIQ